ncbi:DUF222 domain-containing protein [Arthrobacter sp. JSM 101049]|uniref:DUF222 domain-containing protein n=1 Tax=Arthrobacter sp. JSM 101049 TaxID=929097 RepID=UPI0035618179
MEQITSEVDVDGWDIARAAGLPADGSTRLKAAEALMRFAEAEKFRAAAMLHAEAQRTVPSLLDELDEDPGMDISVRSGRMSSFAAAECAAMEIALVCGISPGQGLRILDQADTLVGQTPEVIESLSAGRIGTGHVQKILEQVKHILPEPVPLPPRGADEATQEEWRRETAKAAEKAEAARRDFGADMLAAAPGKSPAQLRTRGRQLLEKFYEISYTKRSRTALRDRHIMVDEAADGMSWFSGLLPTAGCQAIYSKIDALARILKADPGSPSAPANPEGAVAEESTDGAGKAIAEPADDPAEERTLEQLRADVFMDVLLDGPTGRGLGAVQPEVFVAIPATMLPGMPGGPTGSDHTAIDGGETAIDGGDTPSGDEALRVGNAELAPGALVPTLLGSGPIDQESAAAFMASAKTWRRVVTDPLTGAIVTFGQNRYRPTAAQRAALRFRDGGCSTPGCNGRVEHCDADHVQEWQEGGGTDLANLRLRCRRCHRLKSLGLLTFDEGSDGRIVVTSLFGTQVSTTPVPPWAWGAPSTGHGVKAQDSVEGNSGNADVEAAPRETTGSEAPASGEWGRIQDVPDPSCENPEYGRYAKTGHARAARKRRIKRNAGGYGPRKPKPAPVDRWEIRPGQPGDADDIPF